MRVEGWYPQSVFSSGNGVSSVEAWFSTALDIEEVLSVLVVVMVASGLRGGYHVCF